MSLSIGIAIPCYIHHFKYIPTLLQNIIDSTVKPKQIVVSCSSYTSSFVQKYTVEGIEITILYTDKYANGSKNRNIAASYLNTDLISFIDSDDLMHPKRLEYILNTFQERPGISAVYHYYTYQLFSERYLPFWEEGPLEIIDAQIIHHPRGTGVLVDTEKKYELHHAHVTVRKEVFEKVKFDETMNYWEDSRYGTHLVDNHIPMIFINNKLSRYLHN